MKAPLRVIFPALIFLANIAVAQQGDPNPCGTIGTTPWFDWYLQNRTTLAQERSFSDTSWLYVPVTVQLTGTDSGAEYFNIELAINAIDNMNKQYEGARIRYYLYPGDPYRYLPSNYWNDHDWEGGSDLINTNKLPNRLNAFVVRNPAGNCGYSWQDAIVLSKSCSGANNSTWAHEAGHHFSLPHPFLGWEGQTNVNYSVPAPTQVGSSQVEKTDGSNCYSAGDYFCDTRPDYLNYRWQCDENHESLTIQQDPDGVMFRSDGTLIMGYALDACANRFSPEQIQAMRDNLMTEHASYLQLTDPLQEISDDHPVELVSPIDTQFVQYNNAVFTWNPVPNASLYTVEVFLNSSLQGRIIWQTVYNATSLTLTKGIPNNRILYWRVRPYSEWDVSRQLAPQQLGVFTTKNLTATNELERIALAELSPNPVVAGLPAMLEITSEKTMNATLRVTDASGRLCYSREVSLATGENQVEIPTGQLSGGFYFVSLQNEMGAIVKRMGVTE